MGLNTWIRDLIRSKLVPFGGTISTPFDTDEFPTAIANELHGGAHGYRTLEELADVSKLRMSRPMVATVLAHTRPDTTLFERTTFILDPTAEIWDPFMADAALTKVSDIPGYDLSVFWKEITSTASKESISMEYQYADEQDFGLGLVSPAFQLPVISDANYQLGKRSNADATIIWSSTYDATVHKYERQRIKAGAKWGIPKLISISSYTEGDFIDNQFIWVAKNTVPTRPLSLIGGIKNNNPAGWSGTPVIPGLIDYYTYIVTHDLFRISASKNTYQEIISEWSQPFKISTDPTLVRYGNKPSSTDFGPPDTDDWRGYYTPGTDTHMATRVSALLPWRIINIDNESGEYVDYIFKAFPIGYEPLEGDRPTISNPFSASVFDYPNNLWKDYPHATASDEVLHISSARKYNSGEIKPSGWSLPYRFDGQDTIQVVIEPQTETLFKYDAAGGVTPATIQLKAKLYRGNIQVDPDTFIQWYKGVVSGPTEIIQGSGAGVSANHTITGTFKDILTINPAAVDGNQLYTIKGILSGEDYYDVITILDVTDGKAPVAVVTSNDGYVYKNNAGSKTFTSEFYVNGSLIDTGLYTRQWHLAGTWNGTAHVGGTLLGTGTTQVVTAANFTDKEVLFLTVTYQGISYSRSETLVDLSDAPGVLVKYNAVQLQTAPILANIADPSWTTTSTDAWWMRISTDGGTTYAAAIKIRGESAAYNGGFQKSAFYKSLAAPTATLPVTSDLLPAGGGWSHQPPTLSAGVEADTWGIWEVTAFFIKNPDNSGVALNSTNWTIDGSWSTSVRKNGTLGGASTTPGPVGWTPIFRLVGISGRTGQQFLQVHSWINLGGASVGTRPDSYTGYYVGVSGYTSVPSEAINVRGSTGAAAPIVNYTKSIWNPTINTDEVSGGGGPLTASINVVVTNIISSGYYILVGDIVHYGGKLQFSFTQSGSPNGLIFKIRLPAYGVSPGVMFGQAVFSINAVGIGNEVITKPNYGDIEFFVRNTGNGNVSPVLWNSFIAGQVYTLDFSGSYLK